MKKIKTINKLLSSLTLLSPLSGIGFNNKYQNTQKVITENNSVLNSYFNLVGDQRTMGGITVNVEGTTITGYVSGTGNLVVDSNITEIAASAFQSNSNINGLDLSQATSLTTIGLSGFMYCSNLTGDLIIPSNVISIGMQAFCGTNITSLDLSQATSLTTIAADAFSHCSNLTGDLIISSSVTIIGASAFPETNITSLDLSQATSLTTIGSRSFFNCTYLIGDLVIPSSVTSIGDNAFEGNTIGNLYFLFETPPTSFGASWQPTVTGKVYVPEGTTNTYLDAPNFAFDSSQVAEWSFDSSSANINGNFNQIDISTTDIGSSSSAFSVIGCNPEILSNYIFTWSLIPTGETQSIPEGLSISKGKINWNNVTQGTYTFKIQSSFDTWSKQSDQIITITDQIITINVTGDTPVPPEPKTLNIPLILGLLILLGIPVILAIAFIIWYATRKKKTTVKI